MDSENRFSESPPPRWVDAIERQRDREKERDEEWAAYAEAQRIACEEGAPTLEATVTHEDGRGLPEPLELGKLVRHVREQSKLGVRQLARKADISAGQLSRIESGQAKKPSIETLQGIGRALKRDALPLEFLAEHLTDVAVLLDAWPVSPDDYDAVADREAARRQLAAIREAGHPRPVEAFAEYSLGASVARYWFEGHQRSVDDPTLDEIRELLPQLTDRRRQLVLAFVHDQKLLSDREREDPNSVPYRIAIELVGVEDAEEEVES